MSVPPEYFDRLGGRVNLSLLRTRLVVVIGVGTVGSQVARELANSGVGRLLLIDGDNLETQNLMRHVLPGRYVGMNKAVALAKYLRENVPGLEVGTAAHDVDEKLSDDHLDDCLKDADLVVAATDDRVAQRRIGRRALAVTTPAIFPALYRESGGEAIVQLDPRLPCFFCWDGYRPNEERLRGVSALNADTLPVIHLTVRLGLGLLDPESEYGDMLAVGHNQAPFQVFIQERDAPLDRATLTQRPNCPSCAVGPAGPPTPPGSPPQSPPANPPGIPTSRQLIDSLVWFRDCIGLAFATWIFLMPFGLVISAISHVRLGLIAEVATIPSIGWGCIGATLERRDNVRP